MGNRQNSRAFEMDVELIGNNLTNFKNFITNIKNENSVKKFWNFHYDSGSSTNAQINNYFKKLTNIKKGEDKTINLKECVVIRIKNIFDPEVNLVIEKMNSLVEVQYMPLVLFLLENSYYKGITVSIDKKKYKRIDHRLISVLQYAESDNVPVNLNPNEKTPMKLIEEKLYRFCSIHNELGDRFTVGEGNNAEDYDLIDIYFPFNINIACIGRFGQGKSTGVNAILKEYKAKESNKGCSQTKELTYYQAENRPIRLLDIPGFEDIETVKKAVEKFKLCGDKINKIKDNLHLILYFFNYNEDRLFMELEMPILEELCNHRSSKVIYVITHSDPDMDEIDKEIKINNINVGLQNITKSNSAVFKETKPGGMLMASLDNVVFVNFHKDNKTKFEPFGTKDLFRKMYDFFIKTEDYINSNKKQNYEEQAKRLRAQAEDILLSNKIWGGVVGIIPGVDWLLQKFVIKKNAAKKVGMIYGIDVQFLDKENEGSKNVQKNTPEYITPSIDTDYIITKKDGNELIEESTGYKVGNSFKVGGEAASYIGGGASIGSGIMKVSAAAAQTASTVGTTAAEAASTATTTLAGLGSTALKVVGTGCFIIGAALGVGLGSYFTHTYCQELIDKFEKYYLDNAEKIGNSYKDAAQYLLENSQ